MELCWLLSGLLLEPCLSFNLKVGRDFGAGCGPCGGGSGGLSLCSNSGYLWTGFFCSYLFVMDLHYYLRPSVSPFLIHNAISIDLIKNPL